jgi:hypothetical protein
MSPREGTWEREGCQPFLIDAYVLPALLMRKLELASQTMAGYHMCSAASEISISHRRMNLKARLAISQPTVVFVRLTGLANHLHLPIVWLTDWPVLYIALSSVGSRVFSLRTEHVDDPTT